MGGATSGAIHPSLGNLSAIAINGSEVDACPESCGVLLTLTESNEPSAFTATSLEKFLEKVVDEREL